MKKGQIIECDIDSLAFGGAGVARIMEAAHDGTPERQFVVFVGGAVPGDKVKARIFKIKKKYAEAVMEKVIIPSKLRIKPRCRYFGVCGGCKLQEIAYEEQLKIKSQQVRDAIERIGGFRDFKVEEIIGCEDQWYYRNKMEFSFAWENDPRTSIENRVFLGLHPPGRWHEVVDIEECFLQSEFSVKLVNFIRDFVRKAGWTPYSFRDGKGFLRSVFVREGKCTGEVMVNLVTGAGHSGLGPVAAASSDRDEVGGAHVVSGDERDGVLRFVNGLLEFSSQLSRVGPCVHGPVTLSNDDVGDVIEPRIVSVYWTRVVVETGRRTDVEEELIWGKESLREEIRLRQGLKFDVLPQAFFQPNTVQAGVLYSQIFRFADVDENSTVFDLFCGTGTIGLFCAHKVGMVFGIELNESAIESALENARLNGIENAEFIAGDVGEIVDKIEAKPDLIVMDPPRAGVGEEALQKVLRFDSPQIVYVSCNPSTLARDLRILVDNGYELRAVQPVDMFPQTAHIECVAYLTKA